MSNFSSTFTLFTYFLKTTNTNTLVSRVRCKFNKLS
nr:MAG TPA: hypothetical protein [Bacteriophage sp.]